MGGGGGGVEGGDFISNLLQLPPFFNTDVIM